MNKMASVILAAGEGTRMKSRVPKVLHAVGGKPLIMHVLDAVYPFDPEKVVMVVGHGAERVRTALAGTTVIFAEQKKQLGSGHALLQARKAFAGFRGDMLVISGDVPLIKTATLRALFSFHRRQKNSATILSACVENPFSYGRIYRDAAHNVRGIIEEKDASEEIKQLHEINSGIYCFSCPDIWAALGRIKPNNKKKEYYLTDAISILLRMHKKVGAYPAAQSGEIQGVNTRHELAQAEAFMRKEALRRVMSQGVTVVDPETTYLSRDVRIGKDTVLYPGCVIAGKTRIGVGCVIGPFVVIKDSIIFDNTEVVHSHVYGSQVGPEAKIGPFAHLRPHTRVLAKAKVGNFSETKNSVIGKGSKVNHLTYIGDSRLGKKVNVGAGTITCNYDGIKKNRTVIGDNVFVGSNVNFVAPVNIGPDSIIGAGSTVTENVPRNTLAIARARQINKPRKK